MRKFLKLWVLLSALIVTSTSWAQTRGQINGTIVNDQGEKVESVTVKLLDNSRKQVDQQSSAGDGTFEFQNLTRGGIYQIEASMIGYELQTQQITIKESGVNSILIRINRVSEDVEEVVVVGYATQRKVNLTGAVDQITADILDKRPVNNISQALVGVSPNLNIQLMDGKPTQSPSFNVRGTTSIGQSGNALILIDGVEGDPKMLNPNDIENISVLKDAASASIYGARAAFGVVLITTKSAKEGRTSISFNTSFSTLAPTTTPDNITESYPWAKSFSDAWSRWNDSGSSPTAINKTLPFSQAYLDEIKRRWEDPTLPRVDVNPSTGQYEYYYSTDWYKELVREKLYGQNHNIAFTGGNDKATFYLSGRYNGQDGLFRYNSDDYEMYNTRAKGTIQLTEWLNIENNLEFSKMHYRQPVNVGEGGGIWRNLADEGHPLSPLLNPDGSLSFSAAYTVGDYYLGKNGRKNAHRFLKNRTAATATFLDKALNIRADFTFQNTDINTHQRRVQVPYSRYEGVLGYTGTNTNDIEERRQTTDYLATNVYADYAKQFDQGHNINLLAGFNYERSLYKNITARRNGIMYEDADDINLAFGQSIVTNGGHEKWAIAGGFFRVNYDYQGRYLLEFNGRYDGSSKFPKDQQWAFFPSASAGWRISQEPFWTADPKGISDLKIRASYGSLGNGNIKSYSFTENFNITQSGRILNGERPQKTGQPGVVPAGLTWETVTTANAGLDLSALNHRLTFTGDIYRRWTSDMFTVGPTVPAIYGTTVPKGNYADLETTGWEVSLGWKDQFQMASKPFDYNIRFVLSDYTAEITKYNNADKLLTDYYAGQKLGEIWGYQVEGLFRSQEDIDNSPSQSNIQNTNTRKNYVGDLKFKDLDGDNMIYHGNNYADDSGDKTIIGNELPRYTYGLNLSGDWNGISVSALIQGVMRQHWYPSAESRFWGQYNRPYNQYPSWHEDNMFREELGNFDAYLPRLVGYIAQGSNKALTTPNDRYLQNVAYVRLRNLQVAYSLPQSITSKIKASGLSVYISAENLWTWSPMYKWTKDTDVTNIYGSDLDLTDGGNGDGYNYPMLKNFSMGINLNF